MKVLMVCLGNICRSPMAEGILRKLLQNARLPIEVDSAGTSGWHAGEPPDIRAVVTARNHAIEIGQLKARKFCPDDFDRFDLIYVMDRENYHDVIRLAKNTAQKNKVDFLLNVIYPGKNESVPDPWYDDEMFEHVFELIYTACENLVKKLSLMHEKICQKTAE